MSLMDRMRGAAAEQDDIGTGLLARIRALLTEAELQGRSDEDVLDDIAFVVGKRRPRDHLYQKPLG